MEEAEALAATDLDEFHVDPQEPHFVVLMDHEGKDKYRDTWKFRVCWLEYEPEDDTLLK